MTLNFEDDVIDDIEAEQEELKAQQADATLVEQLRAALTALGATKESKTKDIAAIKKYAEDIKTVQGEFDAFELWALLLQAVSGRAATDFVSKHGTQDRRARKSRKAAKRSKFIEANFTQFDFTNEDDLVNAMNEETAMVRRVEERRFLYFDTKDQKYMFLKERDARIEFAKFKFSLQDEEGNCGKPFPGFKFWLDSPARREYARVVFDPKESRVDSDELNLWSGFAVQEKQGDWSLFREHLEKIVCGGNAEHFKFLKAWIAMLLQEPWRKPGVAIALRGIPGCGKTTVGEMISKIIGRKHSMVTGQSDTWTGRFNSQLEQILILCPDESFFAGNKEARGKVLHLITSEDFTYERKGAEHYNAPNYTHIIVTSNEKWIVPADIGDRRMFVLDVLPDKAKNKEYFGALRKQMLNEGGLAAMLYDLARHDYSDVDFQNPPQTDALAGQIELGFDAETKWLVSCLREGRLSFRDDEGRTNVEFGNSAVSIPKSDVFTSFRESVTGYRSQWTDGAIGAFLFEKIRDIRKSRPCFDGDRVQHYLFPPLEKMKGDFLKSHPGFIWGDNIAEETPEEEAARIKMAAEEVTRVREAAEEAARKAREEAFRKGEATATTNVVPITERTKKSEKVDTKYAR